MSAMTKTQAHVCRTVVNHLTTLVDATRDLCVEAKALGLRDTAKSLHDAARTLDGARTRLVEDGPEYLDAARAFINAAERMLTDRAVYIGRFANGR